jgi:hypothetical protein
MDIISFELSPSTYLSFLNVSFDFAELESVLQRHHCLLAVQARKLQLVAS